MFFQFSFMFVLLMKIFIPCVELSLLSAGIIYMYSVELFPIHMNNLKVVNYFSRRMALDRDL